LEQKKKPSRQGKRSPPLVWTRRRTSMWRKGLGEASIQERKKNNPWEEKKNNDTFPGRRGPLKKKLDSSR